MTSTGRMTRRTFLRSATATLIGGAWTLGAAQQSGAEPLRVGFVLPSNETARTEGRLSSMHRAADSAMRGAVYGDEVLHGRFGQAGWDLRTFLATAPDVASAERAARRMIGLEQVDVLIGGYGDAVAATLATVATEAGVPFVNAGAGSQALRRDFAAESVLHVAHDDRTFLRAIAAWIRPDGHDRRWSTIAYDDDAGRRRFDLASQVLQASGAAIASEHWLEPTEPRYGTEVARLVEENAPAVLMLVGWHGQWDVMGQAEARDAQATYVGLPDVVCQTREYFGSSIRVAPRLVQAPRFGSWEPTLPHEASRAVSDDFGGRWRDPMDGAAWGAYQALRVVLDAATDGTGADWPSRLRSVASPDRIVEAHKVGPTFWRDDGQLMHDVHVSRIDPDVEPGHAYADKLAIARYLGRFDATGEVVRDAVDAAAT